MLHTISFPTACRRRFSFALFLSSPHDIFTFSSPYLLLYQFNVMSSSNQPMNSGGFVTPAVSKSAFLVSKIPKFECMTGEGSEGIQLIYYFPWKGSYLGNTWSLAMFPSVPSLRSTDRLPAILLRRWPSFAGLGTPSHRRSSMADYRW